MEGDGGITPHRPLGSEGPGCRSNLLVFFREHDGEDAPRDVGVGGVGRAILHVQVVVIDLEHDRFAVDVERGAVVLLPRVIIVGERVERLTAAQAFATKSEPFAHMPRVR